MRTKVALDVSGLAWRYRTGVQNLVWAYLQAWQENPDLHERFELRFYDRSGLFNRAIATMAGSSYSAVAPRWWPARLRRPLQLLIRAGVVPGPALEGAINHVWNWGLYAPGEGPCSITVPDILPLEYPQWYGARFCRLTRASLAFARDRAQYVFAISHYVKARLVAEAGLEAARMRVVYPGIDPSYFAPVDTLALTASLTRYGLQPGGYFLSSGFLDPRKNLLRQLQAYAQLSEAQTGGCRYALTGLANTQSREVLDLIQQSGLRERVVFLGYVPQADLRMLMAGSAALLYCSIAEGFGLPIIEAMACGAQVITSGTSSMQELAQGRALTVDPLNTEEIAGAMATVLGSGRGDWTARIDANRDFARQFTVRNWLIGHLDAYAPPATPGSTPA